MQNVLESTQITVRAIADELGLNISKNAIALEAQEAAIFVKKCIELGVILHKKTNSSKLTVRHVNMVLESQNISPLLGYSSTLPYTTQTIPGGDNDELVIVDDDKVNLSETAERNATQPPRLFPFSLQWMMIDGIPIDRWNPRLSLMSSSKNFNRPSFSISESNLHNDSFETPRLSNKDIIPQELQNYYNQIIENFESDNPENLNNNYQLLSQDSGINPLLPLFIQYLSFKAMTGLTDITELEKVTTCLDGIIENPSLPINFYVHSILRIIMTIILKFDPCNVANAQNIEQFREILSNDAVLRHRCASLLDKLIKYCISGFPNIKVVITNKMIQTIFDAKTTFSSHIGALCAIEQLGNDVITSVAPHLLVYINFLKRAIIRLPTLYDNEMQKEILKMIVVQIEQISTHLKENGRIMNEIAPLKAQLNAEE